MRFIALLAAVASSAILGTGCSDATGTMIVNYRIGEAGTVCRDYGILNVRASLRAPDRATIEERALCDNSNGMLTINMVPEDVYTVTVEGLDPNDLVLYSGVESNVTVSEGSVAETPLIRLIPVSPTLYVEWVFGNYGLCSHNNVSEIDVILIEEDGTYVAETFACELGAGSVEDLDGGVYNVYVRAVDIDTQEYTFGADIPAVEVSPGLVTELSMATNSQAVLQPCTTDCVP